MGVLAFAHVNIWTLAGSSPCIMCHLIVSCTNQVNRGVENTSHHRVQEGSAQSSLQTLDPLKMSSTFQMVMLVKQNDTLAKEFCFLNSAS